MRLDPGPVDLRLVHAGRIFSGGPGDADCSSAISHFHAGRRRRLARIVAADGHRIIDSSTTTMNEEEAQLTNEVLARRVLGDAAVDGIRNDFFDDAVVIGALARFRRPIRRGKLELVQLFLTQCLLGVYLRCKRT